MSAAESRAFRLTVLNPGGRDAEQHFADGAGTPGSGHQPTNFHGYAACTNGSFHRDTARAIAENTPVLLLLRGDFRQTARALKDLQRAGRTVAVSLKETGLHQIANQLRTPEKLARFTAIIRAADGCIGATPEAADLYATVRGSTQSVEFIPTPYPVDDPRWNFARPVTERAGIFIGTREPDVPSRNHVAALLLASRLSSETGEQVTVYNFDGRKGRRLIEQIGFNPGRLTVQERQLAYPDYLREIAKHKIVLQLDTSFVPGQVAGDALLAHVPCVGGNGAVDRLGFPHSCGFNRSIEQIGAIAKTLLTDSAAYDQQLRSMEAAAREHLSFSAVAPRLENFFAKES